MTSNMWCAVIVIAAWFGASPIGAREPETLDEGNLQDRIRALGAERNEAQQLRRAVELAARHRLSSLQVKAIAARLNDDGARLEFATAAYPLTVDPENYYEVYDAFKTFSKVMRLHDWIRERARPPGAPVVVVHETVSDEEARGIVQALRKESFDQTRDKLARQILSSSRKRFLAAQIKAMLKCFDFEATRLELAKFAYDYTLDREQYFQVNDALEFAGSRESLSQYIRTRNQSSPPRPH
jgi:hypothetical protein